MIFIKTINIGQRIEIIRKKNNESQKDLAELLNKSQSGISAMEKENKQIKLQDIIIICEHYKISADYIIFGEDRKIININNLDNIGQEMIKDTYDMLVQKHPAEVKEVKKVGNL